MVSVFFSSGVSKDIASGDPASSLRATMGVGARGQNSALAPEHVEVAFVPAADSATTLREYWSWVAKGARTETKSATYSVAK